MVFADQLMYTGFHYATVAGVSIGIDDLVVPDEKKSILDDAEKEVVEIQNQYVSGLVTAVSATTRLWTSGRAPTSRLPAP